MSNLPSAGPSDFETSSSHRDSTERDPTLDLEDSPQKCMRSSGFDPDNPPRHVNSPRSPTPAETALAALTYLPTPLLVLSNAKRVILANEAMGRLLGMDNLDDVPTNGNHEETETLAMLQGQTLSQLGIDVIQNGQCVWVTWEKFFDDLADEAEKNTPKTLKTEPSRPPDSVEQRTALSSSDSLEDPSRDFITSHKWPSSKTRNRSLVHDAVVNVVFSSQYKGSINGSSDCTRRSPGSESQVKAKMIISVWSIENQRYFTLTFTSSSPSSLQLPRSHIRSVSSTKNQVPSFKLSSSNLSSPVSPVSCPNCGSFPSPVIQSPTGAPLSMSLFPPLGAPSKSDIAKSPATLQKITRMKNAIIDAIETPVFAMWKDQSLAIPNKALFPLMHQKAEVMTDIAHDLLSCFKFYTEDFKRQLLPDEYPIVQLLRTQEPFSKWTIGILNSNLEQKLFDVSGETIVDDKTGEFLAGIVTLKDVTEYKDIIRTQSEMNEQQFQLICDTMPQLLWTTTPQGMHDWYSKRWYEYTGLSVDECAGEGWQKAFHSDDMPETHTKWTHSLATGDEYMVEYRCRRYDGAWRWMLGRALPLRDTKTGNIKKWFGTCTDIHDLVEARQEAKRMREQLLNVIKHAQVTVWTVDRDMTITFLEGKLMWEDDDVGKVEPIGKKIYDVFGKDKGKDHVPFYTEPIEQILKEEDKGERVSEHYIDGNNRWFRTRFVPKFGQNQNSNAVNENYIEGVIGVSMDVTELKEREADLQSQGEENVRLLSAETAAKEASRLKSQFLANMSHEIRTPIAGVLGLSALLMDTELDMDQRECAENIQRSANGLLTVINDILDFSKVESGRLDVEEVQFDLSLVIQDVCKMLSFAAERKNLVFEGDIQLGTEQDMIVIGDPGRVRQILTNLLTNSIKFTSEGFVKLAVVAKKQLNDITEVFFTVEDTGIGIEEDVRKRLFEPFSQADSSTARRFGGTGLGLTICKNLVELMHGEIALESSLGVGTKAVFSIPFNNPQFRSGSNPLVDIGSIPIRLQSEMSVSVCTSEQDRTGATPPQSPSNNSKPSNQPQFQKLGLSAPSNALPEPEAVLLESDRKNIHVLVVEDNAINQQIALKTVKKFGFSVNAVWNGKEALDYLLEEPSPSYPKPDIILMDVQMPILDGYRATHLIRHHSPYAAINGVRNIPIIAMTASAIQGDKEKCKKAGMDDYLAKPVKGKTLEAMLVKWALEGQRKDRLNESFYAKHIDHDSICTEPEALGSHATKTTTMSKRVMTKPENLHWPEASADGDMLCAEAEEKATTLRDDKLLAASGSHLHASSTPSSDPRTRSVPPTGPLTEENVGRLDRENDESPTQTKTSVTGSEWSGLQIEGEASSPPGSTVGSLKQSLLPETRAARKRLLRNDSDRSQATITNFTPSS